MSPESDLDAAAVGDVDGRGGRPAGPEPYLRGCVFPATGDVAYPRADPADRFRLPADTWHMASLPAGVRLEIAGDAGAVEIDYTTGTDQLGYRGEGAGVSFTAWGPDGRIDQQAARLGQGTVRLELAAAGRTVVHLPEGMRPTVVAVRGVDGEVHPAPDQPRWVVYGDSVAEGWVASEPGLAWPARAGRRQGLDVVNLGYAGAARGEIPSAEQVAGLDADVLTVCHGTNCWTRIPHSSGLFRAGVAAFLDVVRGGHPDTPLLVVSPVRRPDAEDAPNRLGATLADLRRAMEAEVTARIEAGDDRLELLAGRELVTADQLGDGIHPDDDGHRAMADAIGPAVAGLLGS